MYLTPPPLRQKRVKGWVPTLSQVIWIQSCCGTRISLSVSKLTMSRFRLTFWLPIIFALLTSVLWFWAKEEYKTYIRGAVNGTTQQGVDWPDVWTDYTPAPLQVAGAFNVPVATFASPLYQLLHRDTRMGKLLALLCAVVVQWTFVGWSWDRRKYRTRTILGCTLGVVGIFFAIFILVTTMTMHHVTFIYKASGAVWAGAICWHSINRLRERPPGAHR